MRFTFTNAGRFVGKAVSGFNKPRPRALSGAGERIGSTLRTFRESSDRVQTKFSQKALAASFDCLMILAVGKHRKD